MEAHTTHVAFDSEQGLNNGNRFLLLPTEVRHKIYGYLFYKYEGPIWLVSHYQLFQPLYSVPASQADPIFETQIFRCCRKLYRDAVTFAYGVSKFELRGDLKAFCGLSQLALASIRTVSIVQGPWQSGTQEDKTWALIQQSCSALEHLELVLPQDTFLASVPFFVTFKESQTKRIRKPILALDIYVWDRHFSFDPLHRDLAWSESVIRSSIENDGANSMARSRVLGLPKHAQRIVFTADVTVGAVQALDHFLASLDTNLLEKSTKELPKHGSRAVGGRSTRYWYDLR